MKRKLSTLVKREVSYSNKRTTRSMISRTQKSSTASRPQPLKEEDEEEQDALYSRSESSTSSSTGSPSQSASDEAEADANLLIKMEEVKSSLEDGVEFSPGSADDPDRFCQICHKVYTTDRIFENHMKYVHDPKYKLARELVQNSDILPDEDDPNLYCRVCIRSFSCGSSFRGHLTNVHKMRIKLPARTLQRSLINRFADISPDPEDPNSNCCVCQKNFSGKYNYRRHLRQVHKMKLKPLTEVQIVNPDATPNPYDPNLYCIACERRFSEKSGYLSHIEVVHSVAPVRRQRALTTDELPDENDPNNHCKVCKKTLGSKRSYRSHLRSIHVMHLTPITDRYKRMLNADKSPDPNDPNNYCLVCEKTFKRNDSYRVHLKTIHHVIVESRLRYVKRNMIAHPELTPDENNPDNHCQACVITFRSKTMYRRHLVKVHKMSLKPLLSSSTTRSGLLPDRNDPNFYCHPCDLKHRSKSEFLNHLHEKHPTDIDSKRSTPLLPDQNDPNAYCRVCDRRYGSENMFRKHLRRAHKMVLKPKRPKHQLPIKLIKPDILPEVDDPNNFCRVCEKTYQSQNSYRKHLRAVHDMNLVPLVALRMANKEMEAEAELNKPPEHLEVCGICGKGFTDNKLYQHHCEGGTAPFNNEYERDGRIKSIVVITPNENDPDFYCNLCQTNSPDRHTFHNHLEFTHKMKLVNRSKEPTFEQISPEELPDIYDPNYHCKICDRTYSSRDNYYGHIRLKHKVKIGRRGAHPIPHPELTPDVNDPNLSCCACEKKFVCKSAFRHHLTTIHHLKLESPKAFRVKGKLVCARPDLKPDINDPNFFCQQCQRTYASRVTYREHLAAVHSIKIDIKPKRILRNRPRKVGSMTKKPLAIAPRHRLPRSSHSKAIIRKGSS